MVEVFAKPAASAIIEKVEYGKRYVLLQRRQKDGGGKTNGLLEVAGGKVREYENIYEALRREVREETGLKVTEICGEAESQHVNIGGTEVISIEPFCVVQNLSGIYSLIMQTFICHADGELAYSTNETVDIRWETIAELKNLLLDKPQEIFPIDILPLRKYVGQY